MFVDVLSRLFSICFEVKQSEMKGAIVWLVEADGSSPNCGGRGVFVDGYPH